jgi:L-rhamnose mutarotase
MPIQRFLMRRQLLPEHVAEYIQYHQNVPAGLMDVYRDVGITNLSCFLNENDLIVYFEVDQEIYDQEKGRLADNSIDVNWQSLMSTLNDPNSKTITYLEVFRM